MTEPAARLVLEEVDRLRIRTHRAARAHYLSSKFAADQHTRLGVPTVLLSAVVGTSVFGSLAASPSTVVVVLTGLASLLVGGLSALQTFFNHEQRAQQHRVVGADYSALKRRLDVLALSLRTGGTPTSAATSALEQIVEDLNELERRAIDPPDRFYDRARKEQEQDPDGV